MTVRKKLLLAIVCGLFTGGFLYHRFGYESNGVTYGWPWYQLAILFAGIGIGGVFQEVWLSAGITLGIAPTLIFCYAVVYLHPAESMWPIALPLVFLFTFPTSLIGSSIGRILVRTQLPRAVYFVALTGALIVGACLPNLQYLWLQRIEAKTARLLKQIDEAEMTYSAHQPEGRFVCDGTLLPGAAGKLGWLHGEFNDYLIVDFYTISIDCPNKTNPRSFRLTANSQEGHIHAPRLSIDNNGQLVVEPVGLAVGKSQ